MNSRALDLSGANPWTMTSSRIVFDNGLMRLRQDDVIQPDGAPGSYTFIELPWPIAAVVPLSDDNEVHLVRQWRYPWGRNSWEIPAGHGEHDETPLAAAKRELGEEVGLEAEQWDSLGTGYSTASMTARYHIYLARNLRPLDDQLSREGSEGDLITCTVPLTEAVEAAMDGRIEHSLSIVALLRAARRLGV